MRPCGCCEGIEPATPISVDNPPGLDRLAYRVGDHGAFLRSMLARISSHSMHLDPETGEGDGESVRPLAGLSARTNDDPAIALLDCWASVADVLTFYQEWIANEGYLRTATERRSILELARLIGYRLRPGVSASAYLAFTVEDGLAAAIAGGPGPPPADPLTGGRGSESRRTSTLIPPGTAVQSIPLVGELPQTFETVGPLVARAAWNELRPRQTRAQVFVPDGGTGMVSALLPGSIAPARLYLAGISTNLRSGDPILLVGAAGDPELHHVRSISADAPNDQTVVDLVTPEGAEALSSVKALMDVIDRHLDLVAFRIDAKREMAVRVVGLLKDGRDALETDDSDANAAAVVDEMLTGLKREHAIAVEGAYSVLEPWVGSAIGALRGFARVVEPPQAGAGGIAALVDPLSKPPSLPPAGPLSLPRSVDEVLAPRADAGPRLLASLRPELADVLYEAWGRQAGTASLASSVFGFGVRASLFGHNAPGDPELFALVFTRIDDDTGGEGVLVSIRLGEASEDIGSYFKHPGPQRFELPALDETIIAEIQGDSSSLSISLLFVKRSVEIALAWHEWEGATVSTRGVDPATMQVERRSDESDAVLVEGAIGPSFKQSENPSVLFLDAPYPGIVPGSWIAIERPVEGGYVPRIVIARVQEASEASRADYGISAKGTRIVLADDVIWFDEYDTFSVIRGTIVHAAPLGLPLAGAPIQDDVCGTRIELDGLLDGLEAGRWLIVSGERTDIPGVSGIRAAELVMLAGVEQGFDAQLPGERPHSTLRLVNRLAYCYRRDTVVVFGNVIEATHGETRSQVLGSGDGAKAWQRFALAHSPLTHVAAETPDGTSSTLEVRVNDILWHEADELSELDPREHGYLTSTDDEARTSVITGDGNLYGARLPTGVENVRATYRVGIGKPGNLKAGQLSLPMSRPPGLKAVVNPMPATGGADRDSRDQARRNAPRAVTAFDRLVSVQDYEDFARTFAGIGKASAMRSTDGRRRVVHVTIAGVDDVAIPPSSALYRALVGALNRFGDPHVPVQVAARERLVLVIGARVRVLPDHTWDVVEPKIRRALLERFGFDGRELGTDVAASDVVATIQRLPGVAFVDLEALLTRSESQIVELLDPEGAGGDGPALPTEIPPRIVVLPARPDGHTILPAQIAYMPADVPDTVLLTEIRT
jgi:hypothetical protein